MNPLLAVAVIAAGVLMPQPNLAPPPSGGSGGGGGDGGSVIHSRRLHDDVAGGMLSAQRGLPPAFEIVGNVRDSAGRPLSDIYVKLFSNGLVAGSAQSGSDGTFEIDGNPMLGEGSNTVLWFQSPDPAALLDASAVLSVGKVSKQESLFPACTPRIEFVGNSARVEVTMMSTDEWQDELERTGCLSQTP